MTEARPDSITPESAALSSGADRGSVDRLVTRGFWDARHERHVEETRDARESAPGLPGRLCGRCRTRLGAERGESYREFLAQRVFRRYLPKAANWRCLEIGCAPGRNLIAFHRLFGYQPFGVEYSPVGAAETRESLAAAGFDPAHVIETDVFDSMFQRDHAGRYEVILSRGFIEHFTDPRRAVAAHVNLLAPGGFLVCTIPNLRGWSYPFLALLSPEFLRSHNTTIMRRARYRALFEGLGLGCLYCEYSGMFGLFGLALRHERTWRGAVAKAADLLGEAADLALFTLLRGRSLETPWSPNLIYIGRKEQA
ncbi:MAG TPA: class I SAM-dependent methyltransferase [Phycisphaerae bacterium]|nr:class I SAM-dependent methyltransferase [Phycisphaerae bacterium]HNU47000.1 class I SAM-dependent methyltransferase [Phycisphaerae bacterium]